MRCAALISNAIRPPVVDGAKFIAVLFKDEFILSAMPMFHVSIYKSASCLKILEPFDFLCDTCLFILIL